MTVSMLIKGKKGVGGEIISVGKPTVLTKKNTALGKAIFLKITCHVSRRPDVGTCA